MCGVRGVRLACAAAPREKVRDGLFFCFDTTPPLPRRDRKGGPALPVPLATTHVRTHRGRHTSPPLALPSPMWWDALAAATGIAGLRLGPPSDADCDRVLARAQGCVCVCACVREKGRKGVSDEA